MIKVMNIISDTNIGGAGRVLINYMKYYDRENYIVSVVLPRGSKLVKPLAELGAKIYEVDGIADKSMDFKAIKLLKAVIGLEKPDIVHTHGSMSGRIAGKQCGKKVIYTRHSAFPIKSYMRKGPGRLFNKFINEHYADRIIAISPATAENLMDGGISPKYIETMMNGVEPVKRADEKTCSELKKQYNIGRGDFTLGILARIEDYKGHMDILEAVKILSDEGRNVKLIIAGTGSYEGEVWTKAQTLGIGDCVVFTGFISDVAPVLSILDVQLNASYISETSSLSILEGMSMGLPAIASNCCGNPWLVDDGKSGLLFEPRNALALAECISRVMDDNELLKNMGAEARRIYLERFTGERFAQRIEEIYKKTLEVK